MHPPGCLIIKGVETKRKLLMSDFINKVTRPCRRLTDFFPLAALCSLLLVIVGGILSMAVYDLLNVQDKLIAWTGSDNIGIFLSDYLGTFGVWVAFLLFVVIFANRQFFNSTHFLI